MATFSIETMPEQFTEADAENLEFMPEEWESIEAESIENISLEDVDAGKVVESLEEMIEAKAAYGGSGNGYDSGYGRPSSGSPSSVNKQLLKIFTIIVKRLVLKTKNNRTTLALMQAAIRSGPEAVTRLLTPMVKRLLPVYFRWMVPIYVPPVIDALYPPIRNQIGVGAGRKGLKASTEWDL